MKNIKRIVIGSFLGAALLSSCGELDPKSQVAKSTCDCLQDAMPQMEKIVETAIQNNDPSGGFALMGPAMECEKKIKDDPILGKVEIDKEEARKKMADICPDFINDFENLTKKLSVIGK